MTFLGTSFFFQDASLLSVLKPGRPLDIANYNQRGIVGFDPGI
jgi:hypothetical protein